VGAPPYGPPKGLKKTELFLLHEEQNKKVGREIIRRQQKTALRRAETFYGGPRSRVHKSACEDREGS